MTGKWSWNVRLGKDKTKYELECFMRSLLKVPDMKPRRIERMYVSGSNFRLFKVRAEPWRIEEGMVVT